jgi:UDP-GlcNAc:undecaprenyl-phosphate/decaprenyl-phosphate GlcNAc-1-phosphate transferase
MGFSHKKVVLLLYVVSVTFGIGAFTVTVTNTISTIPILITIGVATIIGVSQLKYKEMAVLRNGYLLPIYKMQLMNNTFFLGFLDLAFIVISFVSATALVSSSQTGSMYNQSIFKTITLVGVIQLVVFYSSGLYKGTFRQWGIGDILKLLKIVSIAIIITWAVFALFPRIGGNFNSAIFIVDFYFLITMVMGTRISYQILNYFSKHNDTGKKNVLIYGADIKGVLMLQEMVDDSSLQICPIGFLDDDPKLEGKRLNGYPIFGGHWKLERLINTKNISEVILSNEAIKPTVLHRLIEIARNRGIVIRKFRIRFEDVAKTNQNTQVVETNSVSYQQLNH